MRISIFPASDNSIVVNALVRNRGSSPCNSVGSSKPTGVDARFADRSKYSAIPSPSPALSPLLRPTPMEHIR